MTKVCSGYPLKGLVTKGSKQWTLKSLVALRVPSPEVLKRPSEGLVQSKNVEYTDCWGRVKSIHQYILWNDEKKKGEKSNLHTYYMYVILDGTLDPLELA